MSNIHSEHNLIDVKLKDAKEIETLIHNVDEHIEEAKKKEKSKSPLVPYSKLYSLGTKGDKCNMIIGWVFAVLTGMGLPSMVFLIGNMLDSFNPTKSNKDDMLRSIS